MDKGEEEPENDARARLRDQERVMEEMTGPRFETGAEMMARDRRENYHVQPYVCFTCGGTHFMVGTVENDDDLGGPFMAFRCVACQHIFLVNVDGYYPPAGSLRHVSWPKHS